MEMTPPTTRLTILILRAPGPIARTRPSSCAGMELGITDLFVGFVDGYRTGKFSAAIVIDAIDAIDVID